MILKSHTKFIIKRLFLLSGLVFCLTFAAYQSSIVFAQYKNLRFYDVYAFSNSTFFANVFLSKQNNTQGDWWKDVDLSTEFQEKSTVVPLHYAASVPVLVYHGIVQESDGFNTDIFAFQNQMLALKRAGWSTISLKDFDLFLKGEKKLPAKSFLLTFDDGRRDSYYPADPILEALGFRAVMFVITDRSLRVDKEENKGRFHLNEEELAEMIDSGRWEMQSHGHADHDLYSTTADNKKNAHFLSNFLWLSADNRLESRDEYSRRIDEDLAVSKRLLEERFGREIYAFAFPFGDYGQNSLNNHDAVSNILDATKLHYSRVFYQVWHGQGFPFNDFGSDPFMVKRINVEPNYSGEALVRLLAIYSDKYLPYSSDFYANDGWIENWGKIEFNNEHLILASSEGSSGALTFLGGTKEWRNYRMEGNFTRSPGTVISLIGGMRSPDEYYECVFANNYIKLQHRLGQKTLILNKVTLKPGLDDENLRLGLDLNNNNLACTTNGSVLLLYKVSDVQSLSGGIGIKASFQNPDNSATLQVNSINVTH